VRPLATLALLLPLAGCGNGDGGPIEEPIGCFVGDPAAPPVGEIVYRTPDGEVALAEDGGVLPLLEAPQGGWMLFVGLRTRNLGCELTLTGTLVDHLASPAELVSVEQRPVTQEPGDDGWGWPRFPERIGNYSNLPGCPRQRLARDVNGEPWVVELEGVDADGRVARASITATPTCADEGRRWFCECQCDREYVLGQTCSRPPADP
jgi:hypothetical protein